MALITGWRWGRGEREASLQRVGIAVGVDVTEHARQTRQLAQWHRDDGVLLEPSLRRCAVVSVMQPVDLRNLDDASGGELRDGA